MKSARKSDRQSMFDDVIKHNDEYIRVYGWCCLKQFSVWIDEGIKVQKIEREIEQQCKREASNEILTHGLY